MKKHYFFILSSLLMIFNSCSSDDDLLQNAEGSKDTESIGGEVDNTRYDLVLSEDEDEIVASYNRQSMVFLDKLAEKDDDKIYTSPLSLNILLSMCANGVTGEARTELLDYLGASSLSGLNDLNAKLMSELVKMDKTTVFHMANSLWAAPGFSFISSYRNRIEEFYQGSFYEDIPLSTNQGREAINQWCSDNTDGLIPEFLDKILPEETQYFLVDALYFKGRWANSFEESQNSIRTFTAADGSENHATFMENTLDVRTFEKDGTVILELPFGNGTFNFDVIMPAKRNAVNGLLADSQIFSILDNTEASRVNLRVPKFKIEYNRDDLVSILSEIGLKKMFTEADLSDMTASNVKNIDKIIQKNIFEIDEKGAEGATVTGGGASTSPGITEQVQTISIDHPFMFIVRESSTGLFVSIGVVNKL